MADILYFSTRLAILAGSLSNAVKRLIYVCAEAAVLAMRRRVQKKADPRNNVFIRVRETYKIQNNIFASRNWSI